MRLISDFPAFPPLYTSGDFEFLLDVAVGSGFSLLVSRRLALCVFDGSLSLTVDCTFGSVTPALSFDFSLTQADMAYRALHGDAIIKLYLRTVAPHLLSSLGSNSHLRSLYFDVIPRYYSDHSAGTFVEFGLSDSGLAARVSFLHLLFPADLSSALFAASLPLNPPGFLYVN